MIKYLIKQNQKHNFVKNKPMKKHGGKRERAGRKPIQDKKVPITFYVRESKRKFWKHEINKMLVEN